MDRLQEQGRAAYKRGDYAKALDLFTLAVGKASSVQLFDNRAACYEKLGQLPSALKDAKAAIQLNREDATGYLRAGKVLSKMKKSTVALDIYGHGLRCIKPIGVGYQLLRQAQKTLMDQAAPQRSKDPLTVLPRELVEMVLGYLSFKQRMNACLVSKQWAYFIRGTPNLWGHLDLSGAKRKVRLAFISRAINVGRDKLRSATLGNLFEFDKALKGLVEHCPLEEIILGDTGSQNQNLVQILSKSKTLKKVVLGDGTLVSMSTVTDLMTALSPRLEALDIVLSLSNNSFYTEVSCPNLRKLSLRSNTVVGRSLVRSLLQSIPVRMPQLESLVLHIGRCGPTPPELRLIDLSASLHLRELIVTIHPLELEEILLPETITTLALHGLQGLRTTTNALSRASASYLPHLVNLELECRHSIDLDKFYSVLGSGVALSESEVSQSSKLQKLSLQYLSLRDGNTYASLLGHPRLRALEHLSLDAAHELGDDAASEVLEVLPSLTFLDVSHTDITGVFVKQIVKCGHIKSLDVSMCRNLSLDAVEWARSQGLQVFNRKAPIDSGGKKVRY